ncbi:hypothetical protein BDZ97DRAFT_1752620 [Flammula alnicola]|nr:hypothetical protein BDZ97DRAFT_1752620 [Flammula alnicola]
MVKRPKSPEIVEDARYFTVYQPYPLNANWVLEDDQMQCAMWIAECIGANHLWAIHEKPKARGMILLEVSKAFTDHGRLLGEHRWSEFLKDSTEEENPRVTQVFHSFYAKGRDAQKDGWKVITVSSRWFKGWAPGKGKIVQPYPDTHWCQTPFEDKTNKTLCRPLPVEQKPPPPRVQPPVVGSSTWVAKQGEGLPTKAALTRAWSKKDTPVDTNKANQPAEQTRTTALPPPPQSGRGQFCVNGSSSNAYSGGSNELPAANQPTPKGGSRGPRGKPIPLQTFASEATKPKGKFAWAKPMQRSTSTSGTQSPFSEEPPTGPVNAWVKPLKVAPSLRAKPSQGPTPASTEGSSPWGEPSPLEGNSTYVPSNDSWHTEDTYKKDKGKDAAQNTPDSGSGNNSNWSARPSSPRKARSKPEKARKKEEAPPVSASPANEFTETVTPAFDYDNLDFGKPDMDESEFNPWEKDDAPVDQSWGPPPTTEDLGEQVDWEDLFIGDTGKKKVLICPTHNIACKKGICRDMAKLVREEERKAKEEEKKAAKEKGRKAKNGNADSNGQGFKDRSRKQHDVRGRPQGSKRDPGARDETGPSFIGRMRAFEDVDHEETEEGGTNTETGTEPEPQPW